MEEKFLRKIFLGFIHTHILYHAAKEKIFGGGIALELKRHGYSVSAGTLYPILHSMEKDGLLKKEIINANGKIRKYYTATKKGKEILKKAKKQTYELFKEINE